MQLPPPVLRDRPPPPPGCPQAGGRHRAAQFSDINQIHGCGTSPKDISCCAPKSCAEEVQQWLAHTRPVRCGGRAHAARAARGGPSAPLGLAALPVDQRLLLLLGQSLPLLPVLPAAVQQREAVLRHARQGLQEERADAGWQPGSRPSPGPRRRATSHLGAGPGWGSARCDRW